MKKFTENFLSLIKLTTNPNQIHNESLLRFYEEIFKNTQVVLKDVLDDFLETDVAPTHSKLIFNDSTNKEDEHEFINNEIFKQNKLKKSLIK